MLWPSSHHEVWVFDGISQKKGHANNKVDHNLLHLERKPVLHRIALPVPEATSWPFVGKESISWGLESSIYGVMIAWIFSDKAGHMMQIEIEAVSKSEKLWQVPSVA